VAEPELHGASLDRALQRPGTVLAMLLLVEHQRLRPSELVRLMRTYPRFGGLMRDHLVAHGWVSVKEIAGRGTGPGFEMTLTAEGRRVAILLREIAQHSKRPTVKRGRQG